jgi:hypothetical protein
MAAAESSSRPWPMDARYPTEEDSRATPGRDEKKQASSCVSERTGAQPRARANQRWASVTRRIDTPGTGRLSSALSGGRGALEIFTGGGAALVVDISLRGRQGCRARASKRAQRTLIAPSDTKE